MSCGCFENGEYNVTINLLYSSPHQINNTTVFVDDEVILQFRNYSLVTYPPHLGSKTVKLEHGSHKLKVIDKNFNLTRTKSITVEKRLYIDIIIGDDYIDIDISEKQTEYK